MEIKEQIELQGMGSVSCQIRIVTDYKHPRVEITLQDVGGLQWLITTSEKDGDRTIFNPEQIVLSFQGTSEYAHLEDMFEFLLKVIREAKPLVKERATHNPIESMADKRLLLKK